MGLKAQNFDPKEQYRSGEGESQCLMESYMQNLWQSEAGFGAAGNDGHLTKIRRSGLDGIDGMDHRTERLVSAARRWIAIWNGITLISTYKIHENRSRCIRQAAYRNSATGFRRDWRHGISDRTIGISQEKVNRIVKWGSTCKIHENQSRGDRMAIPKFGDWVRTEMTERNFGKNN